MKRKFRKIIDQIKTRKNKIVGKISAAATAVFVTGMTAISASAADGGGGEIVGKINSLQTSAKQIATALAILMAICAGIAFMCGANGKQQGKGWIIGIAIGCVIVAAASSIVAFFM